MPSYAPPETRYRTPQVVTVFRDLPKTKDRELRRRIRNLARRGFDVPPSRQDEWDRLGAAGLRVEERRRIMRLE